MAVRESICPGVRLNSPLFDSYQESGEGKGQRRVKAEGTSQLVNEQFQILFNAIYNLTNSKGEGNSLIIPMINVWKQAGYFEQTPINHSHHASSNDNCKGYRVTL